MKRVAFVLAVIIVISMPLTVFAASRATTIIPDISFTATTANCEVAVYGNRSTDYIEVTMKLMQGTTCYGSWSDSGYAYVYMYEVANIVQNYVYTLVAEVKINGVALTPVSISDKCPPT